jgi:hypothetical protein
MQAMAPLPWGAAAGLHMDAEARHFQPTLQPLVGWTLTSEASCRSAPTAPWAHPSRPAQGLPVCHAEIAMRDPEIIETELMEISAIADDTVKFDRIVAWCAVHPDEIPFALHQLMGRTDKKLPPES